MATTDTACRRRATAPALTLDERLTLSGLAMDARFDTASADHAIRTAHIAVEAPEILTGPTPASRPTTVEEVLQEAARLIRAHGWITRYVGRPDTGYCLIGAIRAAAGGNRRLEDAAEALMLDRIRAKQPDIVSVGAWNDAQSGPAPVLRMLDQATRHTDRS
ncbi:hypothetical protein HYE82_03685 [Streptomyces sp. BR123]|uniref:DUF6197 family protein n=1 Tax=Streptomyces sp. BR123 TaxID=2749828 RepID=UPI0015C41D8F|nr:hypothetical protein [Streptomyces sp. BR123]NXY93524.1 hypothetical protein [Streptomyces sp. BR123]